MALEARNISLMCAMVGTAVALGFAPGTARASFFPATTYPVGVPASAIGYGDYNGDGIPDLVVARPTQNDIVIFPGRPDGTFGPPSPPIAVGEDPVAVTSCIPPFAYREGDVGEPLGPVPDFNADRNCDLAVADAGSNDIAVLMGHGDGTFAKPIFIPVDGTPGAIVGTDLAGDEPGIVFAEPQQNRLGVIQASPNTGTFSAPSWTAVGSDPEALITTVNIRSLGGSMYYTDWSLYVADAGSNDVREFTPVDNGSGQPSLMGTWTWDVGSNPRALAAGSFGVAVADRDSGDVTLLGTQQRGQSVTAAQSAPIPVGAAPVGLATLTQPGGAASGDLAVVNQGTGAITILQQTSPAPAGGWPTFSATVLPVPGEPTTLLAEPFRAPLDIAAQPFASPPVTDIALLDPTGTVSVLLQQAPRLTLTPKSLELGQITAGTIASAEVSITNIGRSPAAVDHLSMFPESVPWAQEPFSIESDHCTRTTLAPAQSCTFAIRFAPQAPGDFAYGMYAFGDSQASSVFGVTRFHGTARLHADVSAEAVQPLSSVLARGVRATAKCSAACALRVSALLAPRGATAARSRALGVAFVRLRRGGKVRLQIPIRSAARWLALAQRAGIVLRATAYTTSYNNGAAIPISLTLKQVAVVLAPSHRTHP
jgi:hypothetical protein